MYTNLRRFSIQILLVKSDLISELSSKFSMFNCVHHGYLLSLFLSNFILDVLVGLILLSPDFSTISLPEGPPIELEYVDYIVIKTLTRCRLVITLSKSSGMFGMQRSSMNTFRLHFFEPYFQLSIFIIIATTLFQSRLIFTSLYLFRHPNVIR